MTSALQIGLEKAKEIDGFPDYVIYQDGTVYTKSSGLKRKPSKTQQGAMKITLFREGRPYTKSLSLLVARAWLYNDFDPEVFDTPIHLDNDLVNNHVDNLAWRPRWFAVKYQRQYWNEEFRYADTRVQDLKTGEIFTSLIEPCQKYGYLYTDIIRSCTRGDYVFPTWRKFCFVE